MSSAIPRTCRRSLDEVLALPHPPDVFWMQQGVRNDAVAAEGGGRGMKS